MSFRLKTSETFPDGIRRLAYEQLQGAAHQLSKEDVIRGVHEARKSIKRVRSILRLLQPSWHTGYEAENSRLRMLARGLSAARDTAVLPQTFDSLVGKRAAEFSVVRQGLEQHLYETKSVSDLAAVLNETVAGLRAASRRVEDWPVPAEGKAGYEATIERGRKALRRATAEPSAETLHTFRKRVKEQRFQARLAGDEVREKALHRLETMLGDNQDLALLSEKLDQDPGSYGSSLDLSALRALLIRKQRTLQTRALSLGRRLYKPGGIRDAERPDSGAAAIRRLRGDRPKAIAHAAGN